jgi:hypothetical protein
LIFNIKDKVKKAGILQISICFSLRKRGSREGQRDKSPFAYRLRLGSLAPSEPGGGYLKSGKVLLNKYIIKEILSR